MAHYLTPTQRAQLAVMLNKKINIVFLSERREHDIFEKIVEVLDQTLEARVPDEILNSLNVADVRVSDVVKDGLQENLVPLLSDLIAFPFVPGFVKEQILNTVVSLLIDVMASSTTLDDQIDDFLRAAA